MIDRLFKKYKIEVEDYNMAIAHHKLTEDPEVRRMLKEFDAQYDENEKKRLLQCLYNPQQDEEVNLSEFDSINSES